LTGRNDAVWRYTTAGESHGPAVTGFLEGMPAGLPLGAADVDPDLARRQVGYGRGARMAIEKDTAEFLGGVRFGKTTGAPLALLVKNRGREEFKKKPAGYEPLVLPRPGHTDLAGAMKYGLDDMRDVLERASARETAARVALGACARKLLGHFDIAVRSVVERIGAAAADLPERIPASGWKKVEKSAFRCPDRSAERAMKKAIDDAAAAGDTLGGVVRVVAEGVPPGLGSHSQWDLKLDGRLAGAMMSLPAVKGVGIGIGFEAAEHRGSVVHDPISWSKKKPFGYYRRTNRAGGIEGGISNGEPVVLRVAMKPIPTLRKPLRSVNVKTRASSRAAVVRSDICAVPALGVIAEAVLALEIAGAMREKFGGDSLREMGENCRNYVRKIGK
jgi:chorismate synthase